MVYIDTDTAIDVRAIVADTVSRKANSIINDTSMFRNHPTFISRAALKRAVAEMDGMWEVYFQVMHWENIDSELAKKVNHARHLVKELYRN